MKIIIPTLLLLFIVFPQTRPAPKWPGADNIRFESTSGGTGPENIWLSKTFYDHGKQRYQAWITDRRTGKKSGYTGIRFDYEIGPVRYDTLPTNDLLFSNKEPFVFWYYDAAKKTAVPTGLSAGVYMKEKAGKIGLKKFSSLYKVPYELVTIDNSRYGNNPKPLHCNTMARLYGYPDAKKIPGRVEKVLGFPCQLYSVDRKTRKMTLWVEPKSGLVFKSVEQAQTDPASRMPPQPIREHNNSGEIHFPAQIPASTFELPAGTTVYLPETMWNIPLPKNVIRKKMTGTRAKTGFDFSKVK